MTLIYLTLAWAAGIILTRAAGLGPVVWLVGLALALVMLCAGRQRSQARLASLLLIAAVSGGGRYLLSQPHEGPATLSYYNDHGEVELQAYISAEPSLRSTYTQLEVSALELVSAGHRHPVQGKAVLDVPTYRSFAYGDRVRIAGRMQTPKVYADFDYREYLAARGVYSVFQRPRVELLEGHHGSSLLRGIYRLKSLLRQDIEALLPEPEAGLLDGILLGLGHTLPDELAQAFQAAGLSHIIVISGFNMSLVAQAVMANGRRWLHRWVAVASSMLAMGLYTVLVGPSAPVLRATLMGGLFLFAPLVGRRNHPLTSLATASLVMSMINPLVLWSVSFQLSFAATVALLVVEPGLARCLERWTTRGASPDHLPSGVQVWRDVLLTTCAAQIVTLPILWYHFREVSLIAPLANLLVLPVQPIILGWGWVAMICAAVWLPLGRIVGWLIWPLLRYTTMVVEKLGGLSWASVQAPPLSLAGVMVLYGVLAAWMWGPAKARPILERVKTVGARIARAGVALPLLLLIAVLMWAGVLALPDERLHIHFLDVGQGDAILLRTPEGHAVLVDGGADPLLLASRLGKVLPFWQRRIDLVIATHGDSDHLAGLLPLADRYHVDQVLEPYTMQDSSLVQEWHAALASHGLKPRPVGLGTEIRLGNEVSLEILGPDPELAALADDSSNAGSLALRVRMGGCRVLLMGDVEEEAESRLLERGQVSPSLLLKVAHHGANTGTSEAFIAAAHPRYAVISVGEGNRFGHPDPAVLDRLREAGCQVYRTDEVGTIRLSTDGKRYWIKF